MSLRIIDASLRQLRVFKSVVENGGFSAAQANLNTSAASISMQMKELEQQLGMTLCERGRTGFKLTDQGHAAYEATLALFASFDNYNLEIANIREELVGEIRIGLQDNVSTNVDFRLPEALARFNQRKNQVGFRMEEAASSEQEVRTLDGRYNLSIGIFPQRIPGLNYQKLYDEAVTVFCAKGHPLFDRADDIIRLEDLQQARFASTIHFKALVNQTQYLGNPSNAQAESVDAISMFVLSGQYIGFMPNHFAKTWVDRGQMKALLPEQTTNKVAFHLITKRGVRQPHAVETFIDDLLNCHNIEE